MYSKISLELRSDLAGSLDQPEDSSTAECEPYEDSIKLIPEIQYSIY